MVYLKIADRKQAEFLERTGVGEIISPYYALIEEYIDCALDSLEEAYNLTNEEREKITPELYNISHDIEIDEEYGLIEAYEIVRNKLIELKGEM